MDHLTKVKLNEIDITSGFWARRQKINREVTVRAVWDYYEETGRIGAFDLDYMEGGEKPRPHYFWDSDVAKWMEAAAYILEKNPDPELRERLDSLIDKIEAHQGPDGYFNIYHMVVEPEMRFRDRDHHELYCLGHLIEAAVAYYNAFGNDRFIRILDRYIDYVIRVFTIEKSAAFASPGHEEIELALFRLYEAFPDEKYKDLAMFFLNERGVDAVRESPNFSAVYFQSHLPVREQHTAEGHCVRANYLYSGMVDAARLTDDQEMLAACKDLFEDITQRKMYITGGVGSTHIGEAYTAAYDLPNDTAYTEMCAAIALAMFAGRMADIIPDRRYADTVERTIYNGIISGISLAGDSFFYENPLEINLADRTRHGCGGEVDYLPSAVRERNFWCSCCPPNITRFIAEIGEYVLSHDDGRIFVHQYISSEARFAGTALAVETEYPSSGEVKITLSGAKGKMLYLRIPGWCNSFTLSAPYAMEKGYAAVKIENDDAVIRLSLEMKPRFVAADPRVRADAGKTAICFGPLVYCAERLDNDYPLAALRIDPTAPVTAEYDDVFGAPVLFAEGTVLEGSSDCALYQPLDRIKERPVTVKLIPYFAFANRGSSDMRVWLRY